MMQLIEASLYYLFDVVGHVVAQIVEGPFSLLVARWMSQP